MSKRLGGISRLARALVSHPAGCPSSLSCDAHYSCHGSCCLPTINTQTTTPSTTTLLLIDRSNDRCIRPGPGGGHQRAQRYGEVHQCSSPRPTGRAPNVSDLRKCIFYFLIIVAAAAGDYRTLITGARGPRNAKKRRRSFALAWKRRTR